MENDAQILVGIAHVSGEGLPFAADGADAQPARMGRYLQAFDASALGGGTSAGNLLALLFTGNAGPGTPVMPPSAPGRPCVLRYGEAGAVPCPAACREAGRAMRMARLPRPVGQPVPGQVPVPARVRAPARAERGRGPRAA